jgi:hypothetical protein
MGITLEEAIRAALLRIMCEAVCDVQRIMVDAEFDAVAA